MSVDLTLNEFSKVMPKELRKNVNQQIVDTVNNLQMDEEFREAYRDNILAYTNVMAKGKFKITNYLDAVRYVSFKLMNNTNLDSYIKTFPDKYARFLAEGVSPKDIASYISAYNKTKLVNLIYEQTNVPTWVLNQGTHQAAINKLVSLMHTANSEKVQADSALGLLAHLKKPEVIEHNMEHTVNTNTIIEDYEAIITRMVEEQQKLIAGGANVADIANISIAKVVSVQ